MNQASEFLYEGKCKKIFSVKDNENQVLIEFKDVLTAYNAEKVSSFEGKGCLNRDTTSLIFRYLNQKGFKTHWVQDEGEKAILALKIQMIPLEVVVRNRLAGSTAKKFQIKEGQKLKQPLFELYYKDESLKDPFISTEQALILNTGVNLEEIEQIKQEALKINKELVVWMQKSELDLIDFKIEFGKTKEGQIILGDEISADSCRIWDLKTEERLDKDRFRLDLGKVKEGYQKIYSQLKSNSNEKSYS